MKRKAQKKINKSIKDAFKIINKCLELRKKHLEIEQINRNKYIIYRYNDEITDEIVYDTSSFLSFKTEKLRDKFLKNFKELIEQAKDLI